MMKRDACFRALARHIGDAIVVTTYSSAFEWLAIAPRALNYFSVGAMGLDTSHALGLALGRPDKRVVVLQGDGSLWRPPDPERRAGRFRRDGAGGRISSRARVL